MGVCFLYVVVGFYGVLFELKHVSFGANYSPTHTHTQSIEHFHKEKGNTLAAAIRTLHNRFAAGLRQPNELAIRLLAYVLQPQMWDRIKTRAADWYLLSCNSERLPAAEQEQVDPATGIALLLAGNFR